MVGIPLPRESLNSKLMFRQMMTGCPCTPLQQWSKLAMCDFCGEVFAIGKLLRRKDGTIARVPCAKVAPDYRAQGTRGPTVPVNLIAI